MSCACVPLPLPARGLLRGCAGRPSRGKTSGSGSLPRCLLRGGSLGTPPPPPPLSPVPGLAGPPRVNGGSRRHLGRAQCGGLEVRPRPPREGRSVAASGSEDPAEGVESRLPPDVPLVTLRGLRPRRAGPVPPPRPSPHWESPRRLLLSTRRRPDEKVGHPSGPWHTQSKAGCGTSSPPGRLETGEGGSRRRPGPPTSSIRSPPSSRTRDRRRFTAHVALDGYILTRPSSSLEPRR